VLSESNSNTVVLAVELGVELAHKNISQDPNRSTRGGNVKMHHSSDTFLSRERVVHLDDVILGSERITLSLHNVSDFRERFDVGAISLRVHLRQHLASRSERSSQERSSRINNKLAITLLVVARIQSLTVDFDIVHLDRPVIILVDDIVEVELRRHSLGVGSTERKLGVITSSSVGEVEEEGGLGEELVLDDVVENGGRVVGCKGGHGESEDSVGFAELALSIVGGAKDLVVDLDVVEVDSIASKTSLDDSSSVMNSHDALLVLKSLRVVGLEILVLHAFQVTRVGTG